MDSLPPSKFKLSNAECFITTDRWDALLILHNTQPRYQKIIVLLQNYFYMLLTSYFFFSTLKKLFLGKRNLNRAKKKFLSGFILFGDYALSSGDIWPVFTWPYSDKNRFLGGKNRVPHKSFRREALVFEIQASLRRLRRSGVIWKHKRLPTSSMQTADIRDTLMEKSAAISSCRIQRVLSFSFSVLRLQ